MVAVVGGSAKALKKDAPRILPTASMTTARILDLMRSQPNDAGVALAGAFELNQKMTLGAADAAAVEKAGAISVCINALRTHAASAGIVVQLCVSITGMSVLKAGAQSALEGGALALIVATLRSHVDDARVCAQGAGAIVNILLHADATSAASASVGAVPALFAAIGKQAERLACERLARALYGFALHSALTLDAKGVSQLLNTLRAHGMSRAIAVYVPYCLAIGATQIQEKTAAIDAGAVPLLVKTLRAHMTYPEACKTVAYALEKLARLPAGKIAVREASAVPVLVGALQGLSASLEASQHVIAVFGVLASAPEYREALAATGAIPLVVDALRVHSTDLQCCQVAANALNNISVNHVANRAVIISAGAIPLLAAALVRHAEGFTRFHGLLELLGFEDDGTKREGPVSKEMK